MLDTVEVVARETEAQEAGGPARFPRVPVYALQGIPDQSASKLSTKQNCMNSLKVSVPKDPGPIDRPRAGSGSL